MKDIKFKNIPKDAIYKDVVIIGNGPSGITLSYMLDGNWPYWNPNKIQKHPDELLRARLNYLDHNTSLIKHDLITLSEGLEGRSTNPISLLYDSLEHPCADLGMELPSMLEYKNHPNAKIDHIVLGKGPPGGSWHRMDPNLRTLSLASWMSLPGFSYGDWELQQRQQQQQQQQSLSSSNTTTTNPDTSITNIETASLPFSSQLSVLNQKIHKIKNLPLKNLRQKALQNSLTTCEKCIELRSKQKLSLKNYCDYYLIDNELLMNNNNNNNNNSCSSIGSNNNNESEYGSLCCKCTKTLNNLNTTTTTTNDLTTTTNNNQNDNETNQIISSSPNSPPRRNLSLKRQISKEIQTRALVSRVAKYYENYVKIMNLNKYFMNDAIVTMIASIQDNCPEQIEKFHSARWLVCGINRNTERPFYYACANIVLANGASDLPNRLGLRGEDLYTSWIKHELPKLENALESMSENERNYLKPVLIVGAGLSAADAVTICRSSNIPVIHVYRNRTAGLDKTLPVNVYPEYHEVHRMMKDLKNKYDFYTPVPEHTICDLITTPDDNHIVVVENIKTGEKQKFNVSFCAILIGSKPDLRFVSNITPTTQQQQQQQLLTISSSSQTTPPPSPLPATLKTFPITSSLIIIDKSDNPIMAIFNKKLSWLKNVCAKCKHLNLCDWNRSIQQQSLVGDNNNVLDQDKLLSTNQIITKITTICDDNMINNYCDKEITKNTKTSTTTTISSIMDENGLGLGIDPTKPIDCKTNQIAINKFTYEVLNGPKGLYAMGPLVGDNFVRFIPGGALAITASLHTNTQ